MASEHNCHQVLMHWLGSHRICSLQHRTNLGELPHCIVPHVELQLQSCQGVFILHGRKPALSPVAFVNFMLVPSC